MFCNNKCVDCGVECDSRLLPLSCHILKEQVHPAQPEPFHPLTAILKHAVSEPKLVHVGKVESSEHKEGGKGKVDDRSFLVFEQICTGEDEQAKSA